MAAIVFMIYVGIVILLRKVHKSSWWCVLWPIILLAIVCELIADDLKETEESHVG